MTKKELKYVDSLKEENERVKNMLLRFADAIGKLKNIDDVVNMALIPLMTEENQKIRAEIKAEAYKEFAELLKEHKCSYDLDNYHSFDAVEVDVIDELLKEKVGENDAS
jgi:hypothetical protein